MSKKTHWINKPIPRLILGIIGIIFIAYAFAMLLGIVDNRHQNPASLGIAILWGLILLIPSIRARKKK